MLKDSLLPFSFPAVERKKVTAAFDGGRMTSDGGVMLLAAVEKSIGISDRLAPLITNLRNPLLVTHSVADILRVNRHAKRTPYRHPKGTPFVATYAKPWMFLCSADRGRFFVPA